MSGLEGLDKRLVQNQQSIWQQLDDLQIDIVLAESIVHEGYNTNVGFVKLDELGFELSKVLVSCVEDILGEPQSLINVRQIGQVDHGTFEQLCVNLQIFAFIEDEGLHKQFCFDLVLNLVIDDDFVDKAEEAFETSEWKEALNSARKSIRVSEFLVNTFSRKLYRSAGLICTYSLT